MIELWAFAPVVGAALLVWKARRNYAQLPRLAAGSAAEPEVAVLIPARDEAERVARAVRSFPAGTVIVVDDASGDETAARAEEAGALVLSAPKLPRGWTGKSNACWNGVQTATGRWLFFADADTWYEPGFLPALVAYAEEQQLGAASVLPRMVFRGWGPARWIAPFATGLSFCGVNTRRLYDARNPQALINGQCLLMRRDAYDFLGGHKLVAAAADADSALARVLRRHRMKAHILRAERLAHAEVRHVVGRRLLRFPIDGARGWLRVLTTAMLTLTWLPCAGWLWWRGEREMAGAVAAITVVGWWGWYGDPLRAIGVLPGSYLFLFLAVGRLLRSGFGTRRRWKGRLV